MSPSTRAQVDILNHVIYLSAHEPLTLLRDDRTVKDVDVICFGRDKASFNEARAALKVKPEEAIIFGFPYPNVSIEAAFHPEWGKRNRAMQLVSTFDVDEKGELSLNFGRIHRDILWSSVEPWHVILADGTTFPILNPIGHALCYALRIASGVKKKDKEIMVTEDGKRYNKMSLLMRLARLVNEEGLRCGIDYRHDVYASWIDYIQALLKHPDRLTALKAKAERIYWDTIGPPVAHGKGLFKVFVGLSDRLTG